MGEILKKKKKNRTVPHSLSGSGLNQLYLYFINFYLQEKSGTVGAVVFSISLACVLGNKQES